VAKHLQILGVLWIAVSGLRLLHAGAILFFGRFGFPFMPEPMRGFLMPLMGAVGTFIAATAIAGLIAGWGLLTHQPWGRMFAIVIGCLKLIDFPFGTALGIYTLAVLASQGAEDEYQRLAGVQ